jgi:uncharacterized SAM-binding protein YcdF (DUF218 family)
MFVFLSKVLDLLLSPLTWGLLLWAVGSVPRWGRTRGARGVRWGGWLVLYLFSTEPVANGLQRWVEADAVTTRRPDTVYDAVIVLGGLVDADATERSGLPEYTLAVERVLRGYELVRAGRAREVLLSGGPRNTRFRSTTRRGSSASPACCRVVTRWA